MEIELLQRSARDRNMTASDVLRAAFVDWREQQGDRQAALEAWVDRLLEHHGTDAVMSVAFDEESLHECRVRIGGVDVTEDIFSGVYDAMHGRALAQLWVGDSYSDARAFIGRVPLVHGAGVIVPVRALAGMGAYVEAFTASDRGHY